MTELTKLIFPNLKYSRDEILSKFKRNTYGYVTRFAPSPTGFLHIGGVYTALINERIAHNNNGTFYLRIEDTDSKREVSGTVGLICDVFKKLGIKIDEGVMGESQESGDFGPYTQSKRVDIYHTFAAYLMDLGLAYPAFETEEELITLHDDQMQEKANPGYYGKWAKCRSLTLDEVKAKISQNLPYVIRFKVPENEPARVVVNDVIRGEIETENNVIDIVLLKADGVPTYHFAHACDDYLMGTSHVIRGEEWMASLPLHLQLFKYLGFEAPKYAHVAPVMKLDGTRRKLSKRKDPEANAMYFLQKGYPVKAIFVYLYTLINSNFEEWYLQNSDKNINEFKFTFENMSKSEGPLFDFEKLNSISRDIIAAMDPDANVKNLLEWAREFDNDLYLKLTKNIELVTNIFKTQGQQTKENRKDLICYSEFMTTFGMFYGIYENNDKDKLMSENVKPENLEMLKDGFINFFKELKAGTAVKDDGSLKNMSDLAKELGYTNQKKYDKDPSLYKGVFTEFYHYLRIAVTHSVSGMDIDTVCKALGYDEVIRRLGE